MKVLVSTFGCDGEKSGIGQYTMHLMREFSRVAPETHFDVLVFENEQHLYHSESDYINVICEGKYQDSPIKNLIWQQFALPRLCAKGKYDVLFLPAGNRRLPYWTPCPRVGTVHDLAVLHVPGKLDWLHTVYNNHVLPVLIRRLTHVLTVSDFSKCDLLGYAKVPEDKVTTIPEAADSSLYFPRNKTESWGEVVKQHRDIRQPYILYISRIEHPSKNHIRLIRAFSKLKAREKLPHQLVLAGSDWHGAEEVHREAKTSEAAQDIIFTGFAKQEIIPDLYCGADLFVFPSLFEGFGLPILEAMASGVPVCCSNTSSLPEVAGDATLMFDPYDENEIEGVLHQLLVNEDLRKKCVSLGQVQASKFSWEKCASQTFNILREAMETNQG